MGNSRGLSREKDLITDSKNRQYRYGKEHNTQSANPLRKTSPEKHSIRKRFNIVQYRSSSCSETRHRFEKSIRNGGYLATQIKRQHTKSGKQQPGKSHNAIAVPSGHHIRCITAQQQKYSPYSHINQYGIDEIDIFFFPIIPRHTRTHQKHGSFHEKQNSQYTENHFTIDQAVCPASSCIYVD